MLDSVIMIYLRNLGSFLQETDNPCLTNSSLIVQLLVRQNFTCLHMFFLMFSPKFLGVLQALAQQCSAELLQAELERTRINTACFVESIPLDSVPEPAKAAYGFQGSKDSPGRNYRGTQAMGSPGFSRHRRR